MDEDQHDQQNLGKVVPWQIKDFPEGLRREVTDQAKRERVSVGEFMTAHLVALRDAGWPRLGEPGKPFANGQTVSVAELRMMVETACMIADRRDTIPKGIQALANREVKQRLRALRTPAQAQIEAPSRPLEVNGLQTSKPAGERRER